MQWFVLRPVATTLITAAIAMAGLLAYFYLPVASLPQVDFPSISVTAQLPGASPQTIASTLATPLERSLGRISGITQITSSSLQGITRISLQFDLNRNIEGAMRDVQAAIHAAMLSLPSAMPNPPSFRRENPADAPVMVLALTSTAQSRAQLYDLASTVLAQKLAQVNGVGQVQVGGGAMPAVRIELDANALNHYGIGIDEVRRIIVQNNQLRPLGALNGSTLRWQITSAGQLMHARDYLPLVIAYQKGVAVHLRDIATVVDSVEDLRNSGFFNGKPAVVIVIRKQPAANVIETINRIYALMPQLTAQLPDGANIDVTSDRSLSIRASVQEVQLTLLLAILLVMGVVLAFLRSFSAMLIPVIAIPVSLLGACGIIYLWGYSLNNISLMALTIASGFVVDDAIVVLENASAHIENGKTPKQAAQLAVREVGFTVIAMSFSLVAVFLPILLLDGVVGRMFREFSLTLSAAVLVSLWVSLTTTPMLCARWLTIKTLPLATVLTQTQNNRPSLWQRVLSAYEMSLRWALRHSLLMMTLLLATIGLNIYLYVHIDKGFFPAQDNGRMMGMLQADQGISFWAMQDKLQQFSDEVLKDSAVLNVVSFTSSQLSGSLAYVFVNLKPHKERDAIEKVQERLRHHLRHFSGAQLRLMSVQELRIGARQTEAMYDYSLQSDDLALLGQWTPKVVNALTQLPQLRDVNANQQDKAVQLNLQVDRQKAAYYGVTQAMIDASLYSAFGQRPVSVIYHSLNQYRVVLGYAPHFWENPQQLAQVQIHVPARVEKDGTVIAATQVPLSTLASIDYGNALLSVNHDEQFAASAFSFNLAPNVSLSQATQLIEQTLQSLNVPTQIHGSFQGSAKAFKESMRNQPLLIVAALLTIYVILGMLYESYRHPLTILSTLPSAGVGALLALMICGKELSIIAIIGIILLIGIVKKNAIMMIDFALKVQREQGLSAHDAILQACLQRFRPIMMTTLAALLGALPLAIGSGFGAQLREPLGIAIVGGLLLSQLLTLYTTPVVYLKLQGLRKP